MTDNIIFDSSRAVVGVIGSFHHTTHLVASLQVLNFVGKFLGLTMTLMLKLLHLPLDLLIQLLQLLNVVLKLLQQPLMGERMHVSFHLVVLQKK